MKKINKQQNIFKKNIYINFNLNPCETYLSHLSHLTSEHFFKHHKNFFFFIFKIV